LKGTDHRYALNRQSRELICSTRAKEVIKTSHEFDLFFLLILLIRRRIGCSSGIRRRLCHRDETRPGQNRLDVVVPEVVCDEIDLMAFKLDIRACSSVMIFSDVIWMP
jgi:hypothetical protein